jgi:response regulator RpfG family c-di-GMP phosphodiesterase
MIAEQQAPFKSYANQPSSDQEREVALGAQILKVALDFDQLVFGGMSPEAALAELHQQSDAYNPDVIAALHSVQP